MLRITAPLVILLMTAVFLFLAATNIQGGWLYLVDALLWSVVAMGFILPLLQLRRMRLKRHFPAVAYAGQSLEVEVEIEAPGRLPLAFVNLDDQAPLHLRSGTQLETDEQKGFIPVLNGGQSTRYSYTFKPVQAGVYHFQTLRTGSFGPLGLMGVYWNQSLSQGLVVRPLPPSQSFNLFSEEQRAAMQQARQHSHHNEDISHFREYQPGDNKRSIHWKNTAKRQKLIVAEAREEPFQQVMLLVDTHKDQQQESFHRIVQTAEYVCHALLEQHMELNCFAPAADPRFWEKLDLPAPSRKLRNCRNWEELSYWLGALAADAPETLAQAVQREGLQSGQQIVIVIAEHLDEALKQRLLQEHRGTGLVPMMVFSLATPGNREGLNYKPLLEAPKWETEILA